ncbi:protein DETOXIFICATION 46, chloroplastic [Ziziphus jujuba]|uniref:Protein DETOXIFICATION n=1 Tax=Ziziphus jujuba TaxID=326968 RepID=A0A6P4A8K2_ZIZJJ|nr:protein DETOXIFICATION 46, chloroplastic [Ziziphus jujuba]
MNQTTVHNRTHFLKNPRHLYTPSRSSPTFVNLNTSSFSSATPPRLCNTLRLPNLRCSTTKRRRFRIVMACVSPGHEKDQDDFRISSGNENIVALVFNEDNEEGELVVEVQRKDLENQSIWNQMKEIAVFTGPATGLWICGPLMSLIDTAVIGQGSSIELAALGPGTVLCDYMSYTFMFLSIATSNMVATSLARRDKNEVQHHISMLLFLGLACGTVMLLFTRIWGPWALTAFAGAKNADIIPASNTYVQIRSLAWPAVLIGLVAQSASLGMKDSWGPLKALAAATVINGVGDILLCRYLGYGIAGAAWATMVSQVVAGYMMIDALNKKGYNAFAFSIPSPKELLTIVELAAPVFVTMISKVAFYSLLTYVATSMGTHTMAAHQVMIQTLCMCTVWGEPLSQTAQSFMPELLHGVNRSLEKARMLLKSLVIIGAILGLALGIIGTCIPWLFPNIFTPDQEVIHEMHKVLIPYFLALSVTPPTHSLEGTLLAGRDLKFLSLSMTGIFCLGSLLLMFVSSKGYGLPVCWYAFAGFQWARFSLSLRRLLSPDGVLHSEDMSQCKLEKLKAV